MVRPDREFDRIEQGGMSHMDFRALFEKKLQDLREAEMDVPITPTLFRKYLQKLASHLRVGVMSKDYKLDGRSKLARVPETYQELAVALGFYLEERAHINATSSPGDFSSTGEILMATAEQARPANARGARGSPRGGAPQAQERP